MKIYIYCNIIYWELTVYNWWTFQYFTINVYLHNVESILEHKLFYNICSPLHSQENEATCIALEQFWFFMYSKFLHTYQGLRHMQYVSISCVFVQQLMNCVVFYAGGINNADIILVGMPIQLFIKHSSILNNLQYFYDVVKLHTYLLCQRLQWRIQQI